MATPDVHSTRLEPNTVFVLGAGFTKAFMPLAPLLVDDYDAESLRNQFAGFPTARSILANETEASHPNRLDLERVMTRCTAGMPYDFEVGAPEQLSLLFLELKRAFEARLQLAKRGEVQRSDLDQFARLCAGRRITCITFNYDDLLDEALYAVKPGVHGAGYSRAWNPDGGYGFFCRQAISILREESPVSLEANDMLLLKLHGSVNWRIRLGYPRPYSVDAVVHNEDWWRDPQVTPSDHANLELHLEPGAFIVPPVLTKETLGSEPLLRLIWTRAFRALERADLVVFVGYSFPATDIAARFLFTEAIQPGTRLQVVNYAQSKTPKENVRASYRRALPGMRYYQFSFDGALEWSRAMVRAYGGGSMGPDLGPNGD